MVKKEAARVKRVQVRALRAASDLDVLEKRGVKDQAAFDALKKVASVHFKALQTKCTKLSHELMAGMYESVAGINKAKD